MQWAYSCLASHTYVRTSIGYRVTLKSKGEGEKDYEQVMKIIERTPLLSLTELQLFEKNTPTVVVWKWDRGSKG